MTDEALPQWDSDSLVCMEGLDYLTDVDSKSIDLVLTDPPYITSRDSGMDRWVDHVKNVNDNNLQFRTEAQWRAHRTAADWKEWARKGGYLPGKQRVNALREAKRNFLKYGSIYGAKYAVRTDYGDWDSGFTMEQLAQFVEQYYRILKPAGTCIIFFDLWKITHVRTIMEQWGFKQIRFLEWVKTNPQPLNSGRNYLTNSREVALLGVKGGKPTFHSKYDSGVYSYPIQGGKFRLIPTQKNTELIKELIEKHSNPGDVVLDTFAGSGTTAMAAHLSGREFQGCELDEEMWKKSITRIQGEIQWRRKIKSESLKQRKRKRP